MSSNRLIYDTCAYKHELSQSVGPLQYILNPMKYENCNKCRMELGIVGGTAVSHIKGNLVDLETDLRGQTRRTTKCPSKLYQIHALREILITASQETLILLLIQVKPLEILILKCFTYHPVK